MFNIPMTIPHAYNAGWTKLYKMVTGPRGGKKWELSETICTFGVHLPDFAVEAGEWKLTQWVNGWPRVIAHFEVSETGEYTELL